MNDNINIMSLVDSGVGFLTNYAIATRIPGTERRKNDLLRYFRLETANNSTLLFSIEMFLKALLLRNGFQLKNLRTHKIYDLYKKLPTKTKNNIRNQIELIKRYHITPVEQVLQFFNEKTIRIRYNDLTQSSSLIIRDVDVLEHFSIILCHLLGEKILFDDGTEWNPWK